MTGRLRKQAVRLGLVLMVAADLSYGSIVNNSSVSPGSEDSLSFPFYSLDSLGNPTTADSVYLLVTSPSGGTAFRDSMAIGDSRVTSATIRGKQFYWLRAQVSNLDGSGVAGHYGVAIVAKKNTGNLLTPSLHSFQVVADELSDQLGLIGDSVLVKGGAVDSNRTEQGGSGDSASVARWVWNAPQGNHTLSGTFGRYLDAEVSGLGAGSGVYAVSIRTYDSTTGQPAPFVALAVRNVDQTSLVAVGRTDAGGVAAFNLDADSFVVAAVAPGYVFAAIDTVVVTGAMEDTVYGDQFDPGSPVSPVLCRVYGNVWDASGKPEAEVTVWAHLPGGVMRLGPGIITATPVVARTDSSGYFQLDLVPSSSLVPTASEYEFTLSRRDGTILRRRLSVPDSSSWRLAW